MAGTLRLNRRISISRHWLTIGATVLGTGAAVVLLLNLTLGDKKVDVAVDHLYGVEDDSFLRTVGALLGPQIVDGNRITTLVNGHTIFPALLDALAKAQKTITFEMYIYWSGETGRAFAEVLSERARAGVRVHVMIDGIGSEKLDKELIEQMKGAGVQVELYNPPSWYTLRKLNNRTHRKIIVVDGRVAFTGGVGIADMWRGNAENPQHWRDTHFRIEGPAVLQMQGAFMDNWTEQTGVVLHGVDYFPPLEKVGSQLAQIFTSSPGGGSDSMQLLYLLSIASAKRSIIISAAYFVPDEVEIKTLTAALKRGVRVRIIVPGRHIDADVVRRASRSRWGELLQAGAEIHEYQTTMFHCKVMVVDERWVSVGSTNFDNRSFAVNDEANLNVYDVEFAREQLRIFEADLQHSKRITYDEWRARPLHEKVMEHAAGLLGSQL